MRVLGLLLVLVFSISCTKQKSDTFVYCSEASPKIFNPQLATDGATFNATSKTIYDKLVEFDDGSTSVVPGLAEKWEVSKDGLTYTFYLRKDVEFHTTKYFTPTRNLNADDILFTFNRQKDKSHSYYKVNGGLYKYFAGMDMGKIIKAINKKDDHTIEFKLSYKEAPFLANLAMDFASVLSKEYADQLESKDKKELIDTQPIGTGPFVFKKYIKDNLVRYERHEKYYRGPAKIKKLVFSIAPDANVRFQKLKAGECHFINEPAPTDVAQIKNNSQLKLASMAGLNVGYLAFNTEKKPFNNALVRRAINHALNKESYIEAIYLKNAQVAKNPIPPTMWSYNMDTKDYDYNIKTAKKLLAEAGYPDGFETTLWTLPVSRPYNPNGKKMGEMMQEDLAKIGIKVKLVTYKWGEYLKRGSEGEHDMIQLGWTGDNGDPDNFLYVLLGCSGVKAGSNYARWCNKKFQGLVDQAKRMITTEKRAEYYQKAQTVFKDQAPWVTLAHSKVYKAMSKRVEGYVQNPLGTESFYKVQLK